MTDIKLNSRDIHISTVVFVVADILVLIPLFWVSRNNTFQGFSNSITIASMIFWGVLAVGLVLGAWNLYYQYIYPDWIRWTLPASVFLYGAFGLGMWFLGERFPGPVLFWFVILGGFEGILEHIFGIYGLGILEKVPWLQGITPLPVLVFSFFEYILYWTLVTWLALGFAKVVSLLGV